MALASRYFYLHGQGKADFPDGYDAVQAAPDTHKVIFENEFVRVLEVTVPAAVESGSKSSVVFRNWVQLVWKFGTFFEWNTRRRVSV